MPMCNLSAGLSRMDIAMRLSPKTLFSISTCVFLAWWHNVLDTHQKTLPIGSPLVPSTSGGSDPRSAVSTASKTALKLTGMQRWPSHLSYPQGGIVDISFCSNSDKLRSNFKFHVTFALHLLQPIYKELFGRFVQWTAHSAIVSKRASSYTSIETRGSRLDWRCQCLVTMPIKSTHDPWN